MFEVSSKYLKDIKPEEVNVLSLEEEKDLAKKIKNGCDESFNKLIYHNLKLVIKTAHKYEGCGVDIMDLINEGNIGLVQAAKKYKISRGTKFSTYAGYWIRQKMIRYINNHGRTIRIPCHAYAIFSELKKEYEKLSMTDSNFPTPSFFAKKFNCTEKKIRSLLPYLEFPVSIDGNVGENGEETMEQHIPRIENDANQILMDKEKILIVRNALKLLNKREKYILEHRFVLNGDKKETLETIGSKLKVTRERIRQIERAALIKLRKILKDYKIEL